MDGWLAGLLGLVWFGLAEHIPYTALKDRHHTIPSIPPFSPSPPSPIVKSESESQSHHACTHVRKQRTHDPKKKKKTRKDKKIPVSGGFFSTLSSMYVCMYVCMYVLAGTMQESD